MSCKKLRNFSSKYKGINIKHIFAQNTDEFCRNTTLHGLKYVKDNKLKTGERCFFAVAIVMVVFFAIFFIARVYDRWATTPVIIAICPQPNFITDEPFPAVSICNLNQALSTKVEHFSKNSSDYAMLQFLCKRNANNSMLDTVTNWNNMESFIVNVSQPCEDMLIKCSFGDKVQKCSELFQPYVTSEGLCCIFNMLHPRFMYVSHTPFILRNDIYQTEYEPVNWNPETGYPKDLPVSFYPHKVVGVGKSLGLTVTLNVQKDKYFCSSENSVGFNFALHSPNETPNLRETGLLVEPGKETKLSITPDKMEAKSHIKSIHKADRHCVFQHEGNLKFFAQYTQRNCEMECVSEVSENYCGCISHYMPQLNKNTTLCNHKNSNCVRKVLLRTDKRIKLCLDECQPSCYSLGFKTNAFSAKLSVKDFLATNSHIDNVTHAYVAENMAIVHMYFNDHSYSSKTRTEYIGISDFISSIGGLMGLFLGFSFLSIAELIYYAFIRPCHSVCTFTKSKHGNRENYSPHIYTIPLKTTMSTIKKRNNIVYPWIKIQHESKPLVQHKALLPCVLNQDPGKSEKVSKCLWID